MFDTVLVVLVVLAIFVFPLLKAITEPSVNRYLEVQAANRQYMIDNNTSIRPFN